MVAPLFTGKLSILLDLTDNSRMLRSRQFLLAVTILAIATAGTLFLLISQQSAKKDSSSAVKKQVTSKIWAVGDKWTVKVKQDSASVSPDTKKSEMLIPYHFKVESAPEKAGGEWIIRVKQEGASGPFSEGWRLAYVEKSGKLVLSRVAAADQKLIEATVASIVLGANFPYETEYNAAPKNAVVDGKVLAKRTAAEPLASEEIDKALGSGKKGETESSGMRPPVDAPVLKAGEVPPGAPLDKL